MVPGNPASLVNRTCTSCRACSRILPPVSTNTLSCPWRKTMNFRGTISLIILLAASIASFGQGFQGGLRGSVRDAGGAVVPGVQVTLTNEATRLSRTTVTNDSGEYSFSALDAGSYRLTASLTGFKAIDLT